MHKPEDPCASSRSQVPAIPLLHSRRTGSSSSSPWELKETPLPIDFSWLVPAANLSGKLSKHQFGNHSLESRLTFFQIFRIRLCRWSDFPYPRNTNGGLPPCIRHVNRFQGFQIRVL